MFITAGAQLIRTNSYQASVDGFRKHLGINEEESLNLIKKSVDLARQAITSFITYQLEQDGIVYTYKHFFSDNKSILF
jgi:S-methylmethionine-dependent homocysteine/selenocysteine methylase